MAYTSFRDISIVFSGGSSNTNANASLGGEPSANPVVNNSLNNLFDDVSPEESGDGDEDYRCIYFFNDGETMVYGMKLWIAEDEAGGSSMELGMITRNEVQRLTLRSIQDLSEGSFRLSYDGVEFTLPYNSDIGNWSVNFASLLNSLVDNQGNPLLREVSVAAQYVPGGLLVFDITFPGHDGKRNHPTIQIVQNNTNIQADMSTLQHGSPINTIAAEILSENSIPGGVVFYAPTNQSPLELPYLKSGDGFPLWIKRSTLPGTDPKSRDGFSIRFYAESFET